MDKKQLEIYVHIPFCVQKCAYCDFLSFPSNQEIRAAYVKQCKEEIKTYEAGGYEISSVFFGGGTPSILEPEELLGILEEIRCRFPIQPLAEITMEANPGTVTKQSLSMYLEGGINRLSLGLQSAQNEELKKLGRIHTWEQFLESYSFAREAGFQNINIDLMSALPGQTEKTYEDTVNKVLALKPEHISAYSLIVEQGTPFYEKYAEDVIRREKGDQPEMLPSEEQERSMYYSTSELLFQHGYEQYEISNYAKHGKECRHNCGYWTGVPYIGIGLGASSYFEKKRLKNTSSMEAYLKGDFSKEEIQSLSVEEQMEEFIYLGLRMNKGISAAAFFETFQKRIEKIYETPIKELKKDGLIAQSGEQIYLTERGRDLSNYVLAQFLL